MEKLNILTEAEEDRVWQDPGSFCLRQMWKRQNFKSKCVVEDSGFNGIWTQISVLPLDAVTEANFILPPGRWCRVIRQCQCSQMLALPPWALL